VERELEREQEQEREQERELEREQELKNFKLHHQKPISFVPETINKPTTGE
jgi:hypothetical protein